MTVTLIAAVTRDMALGRGGDMIHHISADLKRFKQLTMGHPLVMGRKTFESFPNGPLPGRRNMVVTRQADYSHTGIEVYPSVEAALARCEADGLDPMVIGGGQIYAQTISLAQRLLITEIDSTAEDADTHFPDIDPSLWHPVDIGEWLSDPRSAVRYRFVELEANDRPQTTNYFSIVGDCH